MKTIMKKWKIDFNNWETNTMDRKLLRTIIREGITAFEANRYTELEENEERGGNDQSPTCRLEQPILFAKEHLKPG